MPFGVDCHTRVSEINANITGWVEHLRNHLEILRKSESKMTTFLDMDARVIYKRWFYKAMSLKICKDIQSKVGETMNEWILIISTNRWSPREAD